MLYRSSLVRLSDELRGLIPPKPSSLTPKDVVVVARREWSPTMRFHTIVLVTDKDCDPQLEKRAIVCYSEEWLYDWLAAPISSGTYTVDGFKGLRKFYFHLQLKGWTLDYRSHNIGYHKIDLRDQTRVDSDSIHSKVKSCLNDAASRGYLAKNQLANLPRSELFIPSYMSSKGFELVPGNIYIMKPIGKASSGAGVTAFSNDKEYKEALAAIRGKWKEAVVCRYIDNPLLFQGRKFHLRCYLFVSTTGTWSLFPDAKIITAALPYERNDYTNPKIHDTHLKTTDKDYFFRNEFSHEVQQRIWPSVRFICESISSLTFQGYKEADNSYDILGLDVLIEDNFHCWLLEANFSPGMDPVSYDGYDKFEKQLFEWEVDRALSLV